MIGTVFVVACDTTRFDIDEARDALAEVLEQVAAEGGKVQFILPYRDLGYLIAAEEVTSY